MKKVIESNKAPEAIGPYSQAIECNGMLFISGQLPVDKKSLIIPNNIEDQTRLVLENIGHILKTAGYHFKNIVKTTCYLTDINNFPSMNKVYSNYFHEAPPARTTIGVKSLPLDVLIEIDCIAVSQK